MNRRTLAACLLLSALGCGLRDYEARIDAQRARLKFLDDENRLIYNPMDLPKDAAGTPVWPFDAFLRLPRQLATSPSASFRNPNNPQAAQLFRYLGADDFNAFLAAGLVADKAAKPRSGEWTIAAFRADVRLALQEFHFKEYAVNPKFAMLDKVQLPRMTKQPVNERGEAVPSIDFDSTAFATEKARYDLYFHQQSNRQIAIVFQYPLASASDATWKQAMDWSLKTLDLAQAPAKRAALAARRQFKK